MSLMDEILEKANLKYEDLNPVERETLHTWMQAFQTGDITLGKVKEYIGSMKDAVENELTKSNLGTKQDIFLKARLRNYMLLEAFLDTPERAKEQMEKAVASIVVNKNI